MVLESIYSDIKESFVNKKPTGGLSLQGSVYPFHSMVEVNIGVLNNVNITDELEGENKWIKGMIDIIISGGIHQIILYHNYHNIPNALPTNNFFFMYYNVIINSDTKEGEYKNDLEQRINKVKYTYTDIKIDLEQLLIDYPFTFGFSGSIAKIIHHNTTEFMKLYDLDHIRDIDLVVHPDEVTLINKFREYEKMCADIKSYSSTDKKEDVIQFRAGNINYDVFISDDIETKLYNDQLIQVQTLDRIHKAMKKYNREKDNLYFEWLNDDDGKDFGDLQIQLV